MALISCIDTAFAYDGAVAVSGLNFSVGAGEYLCVVGENGSGKSTLIKGLLGLITPSSGKVLTGDGLAPTEIGYLPQHTAAQNDFPSSAYEVVLSGRLAAKGILPFYSKQDKAEASENMIRLGIGDMRNRCYRELSGGIRQRVLLARALCATKKLLLLDEPASGLDPLVTKDLYRLIEHINREAGITIIMVSHDIRSAVKYASHILHLKNTQAFFGKTKEYIASPAFMAFTGGETRD
jgi:zinc transport system ATP-binding protein